MIIRGDFIFRFSEVEFPFSAFLKSGKLNLFFLIKKIVQIQFLEIFNTNVFPQTERNISVSKYNETNFEFFIVIWVATFNF